MQTQIHNTHIRVHAHTHTRTHTRARAHILDHLQVGEVGVEAGELLGQLPECDEEGQGVEEDDDTHRAEKRPDETMIQRQPTAERGRERERERERKMQRG